MQVTVSFTFDLPASGNVDSLEPIILDAGRQAMVAALQAAYREYEAMVSECPRCASTLLQNEGSDRRVVQRSFGRAESYLHLLRCEGCGRPFRPAKPFLACLYGTNISAKLKEACILAGASWPYTTAAMVVADLCGAAASPESLRRSGLVERAVALVINRRMKKRGMRWCRHNADAVVALRTCRLNDEWDEHVTAHRAA